MTNDVVLTAALRTNLLSLQNTQSLVDITQNRLATGKKINSALDGPQAFFASKALTNRASDLGRLLDSIGQSIQVIKAADHGVTALTTMVEQADAIVTSARETVSNAQAEAKITGSKDLRGVDDLTAMVGWPADSELHFTLTTKDGQPRHTGEYADPLVTTATTEIEITAPMSTEQLLAQLNSIVDADGEHVIEASLDPKGALEIRTTNGDTFNLNFVTNANNDTTNLGLANALGLGGLARIVDDGAGGSDVRLTSMADTALRSVALHTGTTPPVIAQRSALLSNLTNAAGTGLVTNADDAGDYYTIAINGKAEQQILLDGLTLQGFIDTINNNGALNTKIKAEYNEETGELSIRPIDGSVTSITTGVTAAADATAVNFGFGSMDIGTPGMSAASGESITENISFGQSIATLAKLEADYNKLRDQIDALVQNGDTGYRGTNLLFGDDLLTVFNEDRTSTLSTKAVTFTADGLGLKEADFSRIDTVEDSIVHVREALENVRGFGESLANDLTVIQTRQSFTKELINTLTEGSALLVNADQNEEGAKLLALQTRQQLGVTALSLASQSQQAILRLFG